MPLPATVREEVDDLVAGFKQNHHGQRHEGSEVAPQDHCRAKPQYQPREDMGEFVGSRAQQHDLADRMLILFEKVHVPLIVRGNMPVQRDAAMQHCCRAAAVSLAADSPRSPTAFALACNRAKGPGMHTSGIESLGAFSVAALYCFTPLADCERVRAPLDRLCRDHGVRGTLLIAREGINGTIAGEAVAIQIVLAHIRALPGCASLDVKLSTATAMPFHRMKVRIKREIVTMGEPDIDPLASAGTYVEPQDWNALIADPDTIVIDTRNDYEVAVGSFEGAIDPKTRTFRDFPGWFRNERERLLSAGTGKKTKVAMFCTGGIRCEKSTAFLKQEGIEEVYHLKGGILRYLETVPSSQSLWRGECFVFDQRVTIGHGLVEGTYSLCHACRRPVSSSDRNSPLFEEGVSCPACHTERSDAQRESYRERQRQEELAAARGELHVGAVRMGQGSGEDNV